jgi:CopG family nickel-responsive transcriptional regulator
MPLVRFSVSIEKELVKKFEKFLKLDNYKNRSKAITDLINNYLLEKKISISGNPTVAGVITMVYNHHKRFLTEEITHLQHHFIDVIISTQHIHLNEDKCLEIVALKGKYDRINELYTKLKSLKGVINAKLIISD